MQIGLCEALVGPASALSPTAICFSVGGVVVGGDARPLTSQRNTAQAVATLAPCVAPTLVVRSARGICASVRPLLSGDQRSLEDAARRTQSPGDVSHSSQKVSRRRRPPPVPAATPLSSLRQIGPPQTPTSPRPWGRSSASSALSSPLTWALAFCLCPRWANSSPAFRRDCGVTPRDGGGHKLWVRADRTLEERMVGVAFGAGWPQEGGSPQRP